MLTQGIKFLTLKTLSCAILQKNVFIFYDPKICIPEVYSIESILQKLFNP